MEKGETLESMQACIKRNMKGLTNKVSRLTFELSGCEAVRLSDGLEHLVGVKLIA